MQDVMLDYRPDRPSYITHYNRDRDIEPCDQNNGVRTKLVLLSTRILFYLYTIPLHIYKCVYVV